MSIYFKFDFLKSISVHTDKKTVTVIFSKKNKVEEHNVPHGFRNYFHDSVITGIIPAGLRNTSFSS